ncbi:YlxQ family RNA-binding protein [Planomicrobium sp. YIM 101495]|uniref:YlxQ family RNA-binding protein n=1 Tax=Planomicrobium sp. YIM 101495 TaxID=2665160 RepID=UPI0012B8283A|nr:YlxQ family RNA-binding protein [Planomicrobium sp. YIM 101495]MTD30238.1 YlxQ family RNA-binding protein [Planomicrobium sp. YIM 101495]
MNDKKILQLLGLAARARKIISGEELVLSDVRNGQARLVFIAEDASQNTKKKMQDKCKTYKVNLREFSNRAELGHAIGKEQRVVIAINDSGFAKKMVSLLDENNRG